MNNPDGSNTSQKDLLKYSLDHLSEAAAFAFGLEDDTGKFYAVLIDNMIKIGTLMYHKKDIIKAALNFDEVEAEIYLEHKKRKAEYNKLKIVKD